MGSMNLNGRIYGKTADGMILVALRPEEYLDSLPVVFGTVAELEAARLPAAVPAPVAALEAPAKRRGGRPRGKATNAQRRFAGKRPVQEAAPAPALPKEEKPAKAKLAARVCEGCGKTYDPIRKDQRFCKKACTQAYLNAHRNKARSEASKAIKGMSPDQKQKRLEMIRAKMRELNRRDPREGSTFRLDDTQYELAAAEQAARSEGGEA